MSRHYFRSFFLEPFLLLANDPCYNVVFSFTTVVAKIRQKAEAKFSDKFENSLKVILNKWKQPDLAAKATEALELIADPLFKTSLKQDDAEDKSKFEREHELRSIEKNELEMAKKKEIDGIV
jgi:hypothetical protein